MFTSNELSLDYRIHSHSRRGRTGAAFLILLIAILVTTVGPTPSAHAAAKREAKVRTALAVAHAQKGDPYVWGADGPTAFDCSGLVQYAYSKARIRVPRTSSQQARAVHRIRRAKLRRGDLVFYTGSSGVYHVGLFAGRRNGKPRILHAARPGTRVTVDRIHTRRWFGGTFRRR